MLILAIYRMDAFPPYPPSPINYGSWCDISTLFA